MNNDTDTNNANRRYIIWDSRRDGDPRRDEDGRIISDGIIGRVSADNCYMTTYACNKRRVDVSGGELPRTLDALDENDYHPLLADFSLSGSKSTYEIYRVSDAGARL